jgi:hypothetical protein
MIRIVIDQERIRTIKESIIRLLIIHRAYKGYKISMNSITSFKYLTNISLLTYTDFYKLKYYDMYYHFRLYLHFKTKVPYSKCKVNFRSIVFNKSN